MEKFVLISLLLILVSCQYMPFLIKEAGEAVIEEEIILENAEKAEKQIETIKHNN